MEFIVDQGRVHNAFQNQDQNQALVKNSFTLDFLWNLLYLSNYWLLVFNKICPSNKTSRNSKLFYERIGKLYSRDRYENLNPLNITGSTSLYLIVSNMYFNHMHFMSKTTFTMLMYTKINRIFLNR